MRGKPLKLNAVGGRIITVTRAGRNSLIAAMYAMALALVLSTLMDTGIKMWPVHIAARDWRFGAFGLLLSSPTTPLLGLALAMGAAFLGRSRAAIRFFSVVALVVAIGMLIALVFFLLDYAVLKQSLDAQLKLAFAVATTKAVVLAVLVIPAAFALGLGGLRALKEPGLDNTQLENRGGLVVGQPS